MQSPCDPMAHPVVRLMNLHKVKGLEAPIVFLSDPTGQFEHPIDLHVDRSGASCTATWRSSSPGQTSGTWHSVFWRIPPTGVDWQTRNEVFSTPKPSGCCTWPRPGLERA